MVFNSYDEAASSLETKRGKASSALRGIAKSLGLSLKDEIPAMIVTAMVKAKLDSNMGHDVGKPSFEQIDTIEEANLSFVNIEDINSQQEAFAIVQYIYLTLNWDKIREMKLERDDIVLCPNGKLMAVSSISALGKVNMKGARRASYWPDELVVKFRKSDTSIEAEAARKRVLDESSERMASPLLSCEKAESLKQWRVSKNPTHEEVATLERIIDEAKSEKPIQEYINQNPHLLAPLMARYDRYVLPWYKLGSDYVPDYIIGDVDSLGISWTLIELESPACNIYNKDGKALSREARRGLDQIAEWRVWLEDNGDLARRSPKEHGRGLYGVHSGVPGLVIVGRRDGLGESREVQRKNSRRINVQIHTYDWLIDTIKASLDFGGVPAGNKHTVRNIFKA